MDSLHIAPAANTPEIFCDSRTGGLRITGHSYPENAPAFYQPLQDWTRQFLALESHYELPLIVDLDLNYFNSSSSKALLDFFELLNHAAASGRDVVVNWHHHMENEMSQEYGEEFQEDLSELSFNLVPYDDTPGA